MEDYIQVFTTVAKREDAEKIVSLVVKERLAGCAQIVGPITSTYWWKGKIDSAEEFLCILKSRMALYQELEQAIRRVHPYETPEILAVPVAAGHAPYLHWLDNELRQPDA